MRHGLPSFSEAEQRNKRKEASRAGRAARCLALYPSETSSEESMSSSCDDGWETTSHNDSDESVADDDGEQLRGVSAAAPKSKGQPFTAKQTRQIGAMISEAVSQAVDSKLRGQLTKDAKSSKETGKGANRA